MDVKKRGKAMMSQREWERRARRHEALVGPYADAFVRKRSVRECDAVHDFLFRYYNCSPMKLRQWVPSYAMRLEMGKGWEETWPWLNGYWFMIEEGLLRVNLAKLQDSGREMIVFVEKLCQAIVDRTPRFGCFGLHEWAMIYRAKEIRHEGHRLRLSPEKVAAFVESQTLCCTHYDAYRFFTEEARPLNILQPALSTRLVHEQGGCVHANMDLYKWATKLWPWIGSDFIAKAFLLAVTGRELDMRASPYDLRAQGYEPICIETEAGRKQYQREQQAYAEQAALLRQELLEFCHSLKAAIS